MYGAGDENQSSLDAQSVTEDYPPTTPQKEEPVSKVKEPVPAARRASVATSRPIVTSTTATAPPLPVPNGVPKPPTQATRPPTELKYASAVAAATNPASMLGLGPLPAPSAGPHRQASVSSIGSSTGNPARTMSPVAFSNTPAQQTAPPPTPIFPLAKDKSAATNGSPQSLASPSVVPTTPDNLIQTPAAQETTDDSLRPDPINAEQTNGHLESSEPSTAFDLNGTDEADIAMLPPGLRDILHSFQRSRVQGAVSGVSSAPISTTGKMLEASRITAPDAFDSESKKRYTPQTPFATPSYYPQLPHPTVSDPNFVRRCDVDTLFFMFYYQQETVQQYLSA
jgi:CCR4-NOT transcription complex subunit 3